MANIYINKTITINKIMSIGSCQDCPWYYTQEEGESICGCGVNHD